MTHAQRDKNAGIAALASLIVPGFGQIYTGHFFWGLFWLIITPGFWIGSAGLLGWPFHLISAWQAYHQGKERDPYR